MAPSGMFEHLFTRALEAMVQAEPSRVAELRELDGAHSHERLARHVAREVERILKDVGGAPEQRLERQTEIANELLNRLRELAPPGPPRSADVGPPPRLLLSLHSGTPPARTSLPFGTSTVLTRARGEPALGHELAHEIASAGRIDAIISFVTYAGVRALRDSLQRHCAQGRPFRLLTTTYTGATEAEAIDALAGLPGVEVRISYDARRTRLHAKAWLFSRESELDTAYVGSANLSSAALFNGHEWMMKVSAADLPAVIQKFRGTFETLWNDPEFEAYDPRNEQHRTRLRRALTAERGGGGRADAPLTLFTLTPHPFQVEILDRLEAERSLHGRYRNLVVAATGTGKTVMAAFDYYRRVPAHGRPPRLLFLAHRREILVQALATFRNVLRDGAFGDILADGSEPATLDHLFATIQSVRSRGLVAQLGASYWDHVVIDECHHAPADSYREVVDGIRPAVLVGLTATPERMDGKSLLPDFDGHVAAELRLWHALEKQLLAPFEYYGISDNTNLRAVRWTRGAYSIDELDRLYTGNDARAALVLEQTRLRVGNLHDMRALGFCVSVAHAEFMARRFTEAGVPALALHGGSPAELRGEAPGKLARGDVKAIFTCDLYNEGVDLPFVDTLLLLRPTASTTLFLQQLGRGLRLHDHKDVCLVLDFIGQHHEGFRFDQTLGKMTGIPRGSLREAIERGFPTLPSGCHLELDRVAREQILASLQRTLRGGPRQLAGELHDLATRHGPDVTLGTFLEETGRELGEVFTPRASWSTIRRAAGLAVEAPGEHEAVLQGKLQLLLHVDEPERLELYRSLLASPDLPVPRDPTARRRLLMLAYQLYHHRSELFTPEGIVEHLRAHPAIAADLVALFDVLADDVAIASGPRDASFALTAHRRYGRREVLAAVGRWTEQAKPDSREGVVRLEDARTELMFVTLDKSEKRFSPTTAYEDYAISERLFHWQSQSQVSPESKSGRRYVAQATNGWRFLLFVRPTVDDVYTYLGPAQYVSHTGSRPMSITWELEAPIPGKWLREYERLSA